MNNNQISAFLLSRELGESYHFDIPEVKKDWSQGKILKKTTIPTFHPNSTLIWISGKLNLMFTLDNQGRVIFYDIFRDHKGTILTEPSEHAYKCVLLDTDLIVISKFQSQNSLSIYKLSLSDLQTDKINRFPILENLKISLSNIKEINEKSGIIALYTQTNLQIWSLQENTLLYAFPNNNELSFAYSSNTLIYWQKHASSTAIGLISPGAQICKQYTIGSLNDINVVEIIQGKLVISMNGCHLQYIDLASSQTVYIKKGALLQYYQLSSQEASVGIFANGSGVIIDKEVKEFSVKYNDYVFADLLGKSILCSTSGKELIFDGKTYDIGFAIKKVQTIGCNSDTHDIYITEKGRIHILE
ncbi:hypothetical protein SteCoe_16186 [Stentor coeruleus]|uniref:Uncharacterized protein n=1 Tax=Stentor coeruleus TaxID=5963 RepID=A0A1R2C205_9CILI|nr:hypothetical protein SteCoe_16186 [Stentor coeruleus]